MDLVSIGTLIAATVAAVAALWAALISQRQLRLAIREHEEPHPLVEATISEVEGQPDWTAISLLMRNRAEVAVDLISVAVERPKGTGLLSRKDAFGGTKNQWGDMQLIDPLPGKSTKLRVDQSGYMNRAGTVSQHSAGDTALVTIYAHCPLSSLVEEPQPRLNLEMRWRDHTTKTFAMAVNIIKPSTA